MPSLALGSFAPTATAASISGGGHLPSPCPSLPSCGHRMSRRQLALSVSKTHGETTVSSSSFREVSPVSTFSARRAAIAEVKESADLEASLSRVKGILRVHDLNIILRYFGESRRWKEVNQVGEVIEHEVLIMHKCVSKLAHAISR